MSNTQRSVRRRRTSLIERMARRVKAEAGGSRRSGSPYASYARSLPLLRPDVIAVGALLLTAWQALRGLFL